MDVDEKRILWNRLPINAVENIFSFLAHRDRSKASCVCKRWAEAYDSPGLWKEPVFRFKRFYNYKHFNPRKVISRYGAFIKKLSILYRRPSYTSVKFLSKLLCEFIRALTENGVQLNSFKMSKMMILTEHGLSCKNLEQMIEFLHTQKELKAIDFTNARAYQIYGFNVLESLKPEVVEHLQLKNFFSGYATDNISEQTRYIEVMSRFRNLVTLSINYDLISDNLLLRIATSIEGNLRHLCVLCKLCSRITNSIADSSWEALKKACPHLVIDFTLVQSNIKTIYILENKVISQAIPLQRFHYELMNTWVHSYDYAIFHFLTTFQNTLKCVEFVLTGCDSEDVVIGLGYLADMCPKLETLILRAKFPYMNLERLLLNILQSQRESLKLIRITLKDLLTCEYITAKTTKERLASEFKQLGIKLKIKFK